MKPVPPKNRTVNYANYGEFATIKKSEKPNLTHILITGLFISFLCIVIVATLRDFTYFTIVLLGVLSSFIFWVMLMILYKQNNKNSNKNNNMRLTEKNIEYWKKELTKEGKKKSESSIMVIQKATKHGLNNTNIIHLNRF